jgi:holliday junction DNA helicase RuvA
MIAELRGTLTSLDGDLATIMTAGGVGYEVALPIGALQILPRVGQDVHFHTVLVVREDAWSLFGFNSARERAVFQRILMANGVGPRLALALVSSLGSDRVVHAIQNNDLAALCTVSGVGKKKAERMVLELKDRMRDFQISSRPDAPGPAAAQAITALTNLGYPVIAAEAAVQAIVTEHPDNAPSDLIRAALAHLAKNR